MKTITKSIIATPLVLGAMAASTMASQVDWSMSNAAAHFSNGDIIGTGELSFSLGAFQNGFDPATADFDSVVSNWISDGLSGTTHGWTNLANETFPAFGRLGSTGEVGTVVRPDGPVGDQGYMFGYTSLDVGTTPEWILLTNSSWTFPSGTAQGEVALPAAEWSATDAGTQMLIGNSFNFMEASGTDQMFETQAIPEPSTYALIFGLGILGFLGFRRFRK